MSTTTGRVSANSSRASRPSRASTPYSDMQNEIAWAPLALFLSLLAAILLFVVISLQSGAPIDSSANQSAPRPNAPTASWSPSGN